MKKVPVSTLLPEDARERLVRAAGSDHYAPVGDSKIRAHAVDAAISYAKYKYPELFVNEEKGEVENEIKTRKCAPVVS